MAHDKGIKRIKDVLGRELILFTGDSRNRDRTFRFQTKDENGTITDIDISGFVFEAVIKRDVDDNDADVIHTPNPMVPIIPTGTDGKLVIPFSTTNLTAAQEDAILTITRTISGNKQVWLQGILDIRSSGRD